VGGILLRYSTPVRGCKECKESDKDIETEIEAGLET
jgi:hypothetical protein